MSVESLPNNVTLVRLANDPQFTADLVELARLGPARPARVILDFANVRYINSSNLAKLLRLRKQLVEEDGQLVICAANPQVFSVFAVTGLDRIFNTADTLDQALTQL